MKCIKEDVLYGDVSYSINELSSEQFEVKMLLDNGLELSKITFPTIELCEQFLQTFKLLKG